MNKCLLYIPNRILRISKKQTQRGIYAFRLTRFTFFNRFRIINKYTFGYFDLTFDLEDTRGKDIVILYSPGMDMFYARLVTSIKFYRYTIDIDTEDSGGCYEGHHGIAKSLCSENYTQEGGFDPEYIHHLSVENIEKYWNQFVREYSNTAIDVVGIE